MVQTNYWFSRDEFASRVARVQAELKKDGFDVMVYCTDDVVMAKRLEDAGADAIMPAAAPIG